MQPRDIALLKRSKALITTSIKLALLINILALYKKALILKPNKSFTFKEVYPLYSCYILVGPPGTRSTIMYSWNANCVGRWLID